MLQCAWVITMNADYTETKSLELKREYTDGILKSISAFANYEGGRILIGIDEKNNEVVGIKDYIETKLRIEHKINDTIIPRPHYEINILSIDGKNILEIVVQAQLDTPYLYKGVAYQRHDTSTVPVDQSSLIELSLKGRNITYDQLESQETNLSFNVLSDKLNSVKAISNFDDDILITLGLYSNQKYNVAAELLADKNNKTLLGVDIARFGSTISVFKDRETIAGQSILIQYDEALKMFEKHYPEIEVVEGMYRVKKSPIPYEAFREALANAIAHRNYLINAYIRIEMHDNRIKVISPGGLPNGITKENYLKDNLSVPRNTVISHVLYTLNIIERFGTGIRRINQSYIDYEKKPYFDIGDSYIRVILPNVLFDDENMTEENRVLNLLDIQPEITRQDVESILRTSKTKAINLLSRLIEKGEIDTEGSGKNTVYVKK